ncbi:MAG: thermonuclease family protein [Elusimicrobiota bacterium]|jgi:endonuclease YncB( thermonuclease family)
MLHRLLLAGLFLCVPLGVRAHPGGVDAEGCHRESATGQRHCHPERAKGAAAKPAPSAAAAKEESFRGKVVAVLDGDTIEVMNEGRAVRIRLAGVDCPEKSQPFGKQAKLFTSELAFGQVVNVLTHDVDRYGRTVAEILLHDGRSLNRELVKAGLAWWYWRYSKDEGLKALEAEARAAKRGVWAQPDPIAPWMFRKTKGAV